MSMGDKERKNFNYLLGVIFAVTVISFGVLTGQLDAIITWLLKHELVTPKHYTGRIEYLLIFNLVGTSFFILCTLARFYEHMIKGFTHIRRRQIELFLHYSYTSMGYVFGLTLTLLTDNSFTPPNSWVMMDFINILTIVTSFLLFFIICKVYILDEIRKNQHVVYILKQLKIPVD